MKFNKLKFVTIFASFAAVLLSCGVLNYNNLQINYNEAADDDIDYGQHFGLKDSYKNYFPMGAAISTRKMNLNKETLIANYNSITAEYQMKWAALQPTKGKFSFKEADELVSFANENDMLIRGHTLCWHKSTPQYVIADGKDEALKILKNHIKTVVQYYAEDVYCWDVANEVIRTSVTDKQLAEKDYYRTGKDVLSTEVDWFDVCGKEYIKVAFEAADQAAKQVGADIKLFYNDYDLHNPNKRQATVEMISELLDQGVRIDGIGMQGHYNLGDFSFTDFEDSIIAFTNLGLDVQFTEIDISIYPYGKGIEEYGDTLPYKVEQLQSGMFERMFNIIRKYKEPTEEGKGRITGVTFWGVTDDEIVSSGGLYPNRKNFPHVFHSNMKPKLSYYKIRDFEGNDHE